MDGTMNDSAPKSSEPWVVKKQAAWLSELKFRISMWVYCYYKTRRRRAQACIEACDKTIEKWASWGRMQKKHRIKVLTDKDHRGAIIYPGKRIHAKMSDSKFGETPLFHECPFSACDHAQGSPQEDWIDYYFDARILLHPEPTSQATPKVEIPTDDRRTPKD